MQKNLSVINYWFKNIQLEDVKYVKIAYDLLYRELLVRPKKTTWARSIRNVLVTWF
jgi:hypothetical protein